MSQVVITLTDRQRPLPLTETLVLDIVEYLLSHSGYGYSTEISSYMVERKPRRYTSREVVGILRNRPMFRHAQSKDRRGGIRWRLDLLQLERYFAQKGYQERAKDMGIYDSVRELKLSQITETIKALETMDTSNINEVYENIATLWS